MNKVNYQKALERILGSLELHNGEPRKRLFLHACCAPCSSYVLEYLRDYFDITLFYYNPNITDREEYEKRVEELKRLAAIMQRQDVELTCQSDNQNSGFSVQTENLPARKNWFIEVEEGLYEPNRFFEMARGLEEIPEGGPRCFGCYEMRLRETARRAAEGGYDYFATTLTISPLKNAEKLNEIGERLAAEYGVAHLPSDFKKKNGYKRSVELSEQYGLYRQDYCGCIYSMRG